MNLVIHVCIQVALHKESPCCDTDNVCVLICQITVYFVCVRMSMLVSITLVCVVISCMISVALIKSPEILVKIDLNFLYSIGLLFTIILLRFTHYKT